MASPSAVRILPILLSFSLAVLTSCADSSGENDVPDSTATLQQAGPNDQAAVTPDSVWMARGLPDPSRPWNAEEKQKALEALQKESGRSGELPRYDSTGKNRMFARIALPENIEFFRNDSLTAQERVNRGMVAVSYILQMYMLYTGRLMSGAEHSEEITQLIPNLLRIEAEFTRVGMEMVEAFPQKRRETEQVRTGVRQMREGLVGSIDAVLRVLRDKTVFTSGQLERIAAALRETAPAMLPYIEEEERAQLQAEAEATIAETENESVKNVLRELFPAK